jgi:HemY protein
MRLLLAFFLILLAAIAIALLAYQDPGYVLIGRGHTTVEMSLSLFATLVIISFTILYLLIRFVLRTWHMPAQIRLWRERRRTNKARHSLRRGLIELAEGHWKKAERALIRYVKHSSTPLLNYLSAARAAQKQNAHERRDHYLAMAMQSMPDADVAVELTQAELQMAHGQLEQSLATLEHIRTIAPNHTHVLLLLSQLYEQLQSWGDLRDLLPLLQKHKVVDEKILVEISQKTYSKLLTIAAKSGNPSNLLHEWEEIPRGLRNSKILAIEYAQHLLEVKQYDKAETFIRERLKREWDQHLVYLYGHIRIDQSEKQLGYAEAWLKGRESNPVLLLTLGRIAHYGKLWGKARSYLEASIGNGPRAETYKELGLLLEQLEEPQAAADCYRKGIMLVTEHEVAYPLRRTH